MHFRTLVLNLIFLIFSLTFFTSKGYVGGSLILIDDWLKRDLLFSLVGLVYYYYFLVRISLLVPGLLGLDSFFLGLLSISHLLISRGATL